MRTPLSLLAFQFLAHAASVCVRACGCVCACGKDGNFPDQCIFQCAMYCQYLHSIRMCRWLCWLSVCSAPTGFLFTLCALQTFAQGLGLVLQKQLIFSNVSQRQFHVAQRSVFGIRMPVDEPFLGTLKWPRFNPLCSNLHTLTFFSFSLLLSTFSERFQLRLLDNCPWKISAICKNGLF